MSRGSSKPEGGEGTGASRDLERLWPRTLDEARAAAPTHLARYRRALALSEGRRVCDVACGVGYGTAYLARRAVSVTGMDLNAEAIDWARRQFSAANTSFFVADVQDRWPVDGPFDVIVSFETLEHLDAPDRFLEQAVRHLTEEGTMILSIPNGVRDRLRHPENVHHKQHFDTDAIQVLIGRHFGEAQFFAQHYRRDLRHRLMRLGSGRGARLLENFTFDPGLDPAAKTWLVIARRPRLGGGAG